MSKKQDEVLLSEEYAPGKCNIIYKRHGNKKCFLMLSRNKIKLCNCFAVLIQHTWQKHY